MVSAWRSTAVAAGGTLMEGPMNYTVERETTRTPAQVREALERLDAEHEEADPERQYAQRREVLERELAEAERAEAMSQYQQLRVSIENDIARQDALYATIDGALAPVLTLMLEALDLQDHLDDALHDLNYLAPRARVAYGPPQRTVREWGEYVSRRLRERRRTRP